MFSPMTRLIDGASRSRLFFWWQFETFHAFEVVTVVFLFRCNGVVDETRGSARGLSSIDFAEFDRSGLMAFERIGPPRASPSIRSFRFAMNKFSLLPVRIVARTYSNG